MRHPADILNPTAMRPAVIPDPIRNLCKDRKPIMYGRSDLICTALAPASIISITSCQHEIPQGVEERLISAPT
jgi:hypothetical protein